MKEALLNLIDGWKGDSDVLDMIQINLDRICSYVNSVVRMEYMQPIIYARYEGEEIREKIEEFDKRRHIAHEAAISAVSQLVRWAQLVEAEPIFKGDVTDRYEVADFCLEFVDAMFKGRNLITDFNLGCKTLENYIERCIDK